MRCVFTLRRRRIVRVISGSRVGAARVSRFGVANRTRLGTRTGSGRCRRAVRRTRFLVATHAVRRREALRGATRERARQETKHRERVGPEAPAQARSVTRNTVFHINKLAAGSFTMCHDSRPGQRSYRPGDICALVHHRRRGIIHRRQGAARLVVVGGVREWTPLTRARSPTAHLRAALLSQRQLGALVPGIRADDVGLADS